MDAVYPSLSPDSPLAPGRSPPRGRSPGRPPLAGRAGFFFVPRRSWASWKVVGSRLAVGLVDSLVHLDAVDGVVVTGVSVGLDCPLEVLLLFVEKAELLPSPRSFGGVAGLRERLFEGGVGLTKPPVESHRLPG